MITQELSTAHDKWSVKFQFALSDIILYFFLIFTIIAKSGK